MTTKTLIPIIYRDTNHHKLLDEITTFITTCDSDSNYYKKRSDSDSNYVTMANLSVKTFKNFNKYRHMHVPKEYKITNLSKYGVQNELKKHFIQLVGCRHV